MAGFKESYTDYQARDFSKLRGLDGISDEQIEQHLKLYAGYVTNMNKSNTITRELADADKVGSYEWAEVRRRLGWETNGVRLHELYFENLGGSGPQSSGKLADELTKNFGSFDNWHADFTKTAAMRGVGWTILYRDPVSGMMNNYWITEHEMGHPAGWSPILVMDIWEHAFTVDFKPTERPKYIEAFMKNINWEAAERRL